MTGERLQVLCAESELQEYGETIRVGQTVRRLAGRRSGAFLGGRLDELEWWFDRYAEVVGHPSAMIHGRVVAIDAVFAALQQQDDGTWGPQPGSAHLERIDSTADTRAVEQEFDVGQRFPDGRGGFWAARIPVHRDGDETGAGWLLTLEDVRIEPPDPA